MTTAQKYSRPVRRGFGLLVAAGLRRSMEALIAEQARHPKRSERHTAREKSDILAMVDYIEQEAEEFYEEGGPVQSLPPLHSLCVFCGEKLNPDHSCPSCTGQVVAPGVGGEVAVAT